MDEITEDAEEGQSTAGESASTARPATAGSVKPIIVEPPAQEETKQGTTTTTVSQPETKAEDSKGTPELSHVTIEHVTHSDEHSGPKTAPIRESFKDYDLLFENGPDPRFSSQTARPAISDLYAEIYAQYNKPKVKLGPRPKQSLDVKRPHTSGNGAQGASRPVSSLPAGLRSANRKTMEPKRPKSRDTSTVPSIAFPPPPPVPSVPEIPVSPTYAPKSPASVRSLPVHTYSSHSHKSAGITPEKQRLMKALEMRKKQMKARKEREAKEAAEAESVSPPVETTAEEPAESVEVVKTESAPMETLKEEVSPTATPEESPVVLDEEEGVSSKQTDSNTDSTPTVTQEDLDVGMTGNQTETDDIHSAASASSPTSAQTQGSSAAPSTRPSSISEDDPQAPTETKVEEEEESSKGADEKPREDEEDSIESSPTVVPESSTPVPAVEVSAQEEQSPAPIQQASESDDALIRRSKRESMVLVPPSDLDDARARRRSKRESILFVPSNVTPEDSTPSRKQKRESMILAVPQGQNFMESQEKRRTMIDLIHLSAENSEAEYLSDDSFMEELQSAKFEEAKPVSVSKSPITPFFPRKTSMSESPHLERSASQQYAKPGRLSPDQLGPRKLSGPWPPQHANTDSVVVAKKINVGSGISQRIKALAEKSNRDSSASVSPVATPDASNSIVAQRKSSFFATPPSGNSPNGKPIQRLSRASFATASNSTTPDKKPVFQPPSPEPEDKRRTVYNVQQGFEKPESVQVTARIVRDSRVQQPTLTMPTENTPLELHQSAIVIDHHQRSTRPASSSRSPIKTEPTSPRPPSSSHSKEASFGLPRSSSESSWRSFGRRLSESKAPGPPRSQSANSGESGDEKQEKKDKKDSRTSKLFKRMSTISSISRKNSAASTTLPEEELQATLLPSLREPPPPVQVGDLNIQFPDTLVRSGPINSLTETNSIYSCGNGDGSRLMRWAILY